METRPYLFTERKGSQLTEVLTRMHQLRLSLPGAFVLVPYGLQGAVLCADMQLVEAGQTGPDLSHGVAGERS